MTLCAYCREDRPLTREHIIPAFIYDFQKQQEGTFIGWNEVAQRMVGGEGKIKDVCEDCNNGVLSDLDSYGKHLLTDSGLLVQNYTKQGLALRYDYSLLLRWLLKISFNSSRTDGAHSHLFERFIPFIRGLASAPSRFHVASLVYLARPEVAGLSQIEADSFIRMSQGASLLNPFVARICYAAALGERDFVARQIIFGPAVFYLLFFREGLLPGHAASAIRRLTKAVPEIVELSSKRKFVEVHPGQKTWLDLYEPQVARTIALKRGD
ncbi:HNH endonuclease [Burkholderia sp. Ax-1719]|uniref:HNH endonuclease n=1 Tax=Burkholderia sp. Ax-1719 TaxID=2608334 RepID=UPI00141FF131|nr:HNH endonuclease [Burkholderia sp. Ax-1719]NIE64032.1 HNH endonuclease [Burkholderia sp. Ax-1719]